tara:strand:- start:263 stop:394 length:132 start_codon:yes stop_codon:yes gene_type:complete
MEIRYLKRIKCYGDMLRGENHEYETVLQYKEDGVWYDVETVKE